MNRREVVGVLGATAAGLAAITGGGASAQEVRAQKHDRQMFHPERGHHTEVQQECAEACARCMHECEDGFHHCLRQAQSEKAEYALAAQMCIDCARCAARRLSWWHAGARSWSISARPAPRSATIVSPRASRSTILR